jgi:hypothetical protein
MINIEGSFKKISLDELKNILKRGGIDFSQWGKGGTKTLNHLQKEIENEECALIIGKQGEVLREVVIARANIFYISKEGKKYRLKEEKQVFKDGRERRRNLKYSLNEKVKFGENIKEAMIRGIKEELGIEGDLSLKETGIEEETEDSPSYPGLKSHYIYHNFEVSLNDQQFNPNGYIEDQEDKTTYFIWEEIG